MLKKILAAAAVGVLALGLAACQNKTENNGATDENGQPSVEQSGDANKPADNSGAQSGTDAAGSNTSSLNSTGTDNATAAAPAEGSQDTTATQ